MEEPMDQWLWYCDSNTFIDPESRMQKMRGKDQRMYLCVTLCY